MAGVKRSVAIKDFLQKNTWEDLAALYNDGMEVQVLVAQDGGERVENHFQGHNWHSFTDNVQTWSPFRIPKNSMLEPEDNDFEIRFDLGLHVEGIGMTGWNWKKRRSNYVAFDFDALLGHSEKHTKKLSFMELEEIKKKVNDVEWVTLRRSTGGSGLHLYVFIDESFNDEIINHNWHMCIGRAILNQLSALCGFEFESKVDVSAGNIWVYHRKMVRPDMTRNPDSLLLLKQGIPLKDIPKNWRDYIDVITGKRRQVVPFFIKETDNPEKEFDQFEEISNQRLKIPLDSDHSRLINWIKDNTPGGSYWQNEHWMLVTHTYVLKLAHEALGLKGPYKTFSEGTEFGSDKNAFCFPQPNGAWVVRRYTRGCQEENTWEQDGQGFTRCFLNKIPEFKLSCKLNNGVEKSNGSFVFTEVRKAIEAARFMGVRLVVPERYLSRNAVLKQHKDKRLIIEFTKENSDTGDGMDGFDGSGKCWSKIIDGKIDNTVTNNTNIDMMVLDKIVRHVVNEGGVDEGWVVRSGTAGEEWRDEPLEHVKLILKGHFGYKPSDVDGILGTGAIQPYKIVNQPFEPEYLPGRLWNRKGAKLRFQPSQADISDLRFPTWLKIFNHLGSNLTETISRNPWAVTNNVKTGSDYLIIWIAALFQQPYQRLPYLFFYSEEQDTGKSTFHEAIALLIDGDPPRGYMKVSEALKAASQFNAELQHSILCVVEELDLNPKRADAKISYNRIKELITANNISIHEKRQTPVMVRNTTHFVQCSNDRGSCPIFKNDSRVTMIKVDSLDEIEKIPKSRLLEQLITEGPDFLAHILRLEIPPSNDRLIVPVIETEDKAIVQSSNLDLVEQFIKEVCYVVDGEMILWDEFYQRFAKWLEPLDLEKWTKRYTGSRLPDYHPKSRRKGDAQFCIANISWEPKTPKTPIKERLVIRGDYLTTISTNGVPNGE